MRPATVEKMWKRRAQTVDGLGRPQEHAQSRPSDADPDRQGAFVDLFA
jgi:hypothetical protein